MRRRQQQRQWRTRLAMGTVIFFVGIAIFASFIASDRSIAIQRNGAVHWFGNLGWSAGAEVDEPLDPFDWALWPPVRHHPIAVRSPASADRIEVLSPPSSRHWLGTDDRGRDVLARLIHGSRSTLILAIGVAGLSLVIGIGLAGWAFMGGRVTGLILEPTLDAASGLPAILLVVAAQGLWGASSLWLAILVLAVPRTAQCGRIAITSIRSLEATPLAESARALGVSSVRLFFRHLLPNGMKPLWVATALTAALAVLAEAALSFLGFGTPAPEPSWGELLAQAHQNGLLWWLLIPAGGCATVLAAAFGALADSA